MRGLRVILYNCKLCSDDAYVINVNREVSLLLEFKLASSSYKIILEGQRKLQINAYYTSYYRNTEKV